MPKKTKVAVIGLGWPGREHLKGYKQCAGAEVVALCDMNGELADQQAQEHGVAAVFADHKQMFKEIEVDAVSVCLPNFLHAPVSLDALKAGKHVICEKPPALNARQAQQMEKAAQTNGLVMMYALCQRFGGAATVAKQFIDDGELGEIYYGRAVYHRRRGIPLGTGSWFTDKSRSGGGALIDIGVHALDCVWWLMGTPKPVSVSGSAFHKFGHVVPKGTHFDVDDSAFALIKFDNGGTLMLECSWALNLPGGGGLQVAGDKGGAVLNPLTIYSERNGVQVDITPEVPNLDAFAGQTGHFVECIQKGKTPLMSATQGVQLMQMLDGIYKSAATGREVRIK
ncbi:MAG: gfo/Idh/MocA family oxidoreductase [Candidatus Latescibacteria bacterium]|nr:gfo/Idh/MocA family oxidoreductase [Candidatus Latescibacterota bacterium]